MAVRCAQADGLQLEAEQQHLKRQEAALAERLSRLEVQVWASLRFQTAQRSRHD